MRPLPKSPHQPVATKTSEEAQEEASELWLQLTQLPRPGRPIPFPRNLPGTEDPVGECWVWPLTHEEQQLASVEADRHVRAILKDPQKKDEANLGYHHLHSNELCVQILWRACRDLNDGANKYRKPAFPSPKVMRREFTNDELGVLFASYLTVQQEVGPIVAFLSKEEQDALILKLHEGGSAFPLASLSPDEQNVLMTSMASRLVNCWMAMSSVGLPLDATSVAESRVAEYLAEAEQKQAESDALANTQPAPPATDTADPAETPPSE